MSPLSGAESHLYRRTFGLCLAACVAGIATACWMWGAVEVRGHVFETVFLSFVGLWGLLMVHVVIPWLGLDFQYDVVERRNPGALVAMCGATIALALIYAGGNLGEGPSFLNNVFSAGLGIAVFFFLWILLEITGRVSVSITEERDLASGIRLSGFLLSPGLILARAVAGDWHSETATLQDLVRDGWPAGAVCIAAIAVERSLRPSRVRPFPAWQTCGLAPALVYVTFAIAWVWHLGRWEGMPR